VAKKIYLETTMFNFYYAPDKPGYALWQSQTRRVFDQIQEGKYEPYTSGFTLEELFLATDDERRSLMLSLVNRYNITVLPESTEIKRLSDLYVADKVLSSAHSMDISHIAITTAYGLDFIVSLNFEHIVRPWTIERVREVNIREGYKGIGIYQPSEVLKL
jgi:hypothetical protein